MMLNKTFYLILLSLIPLLGFSQANSQYPDSGNKIRLGFQTTGDGLIWRDTQPKVAGYQPINNKAAWIVLDTVNNKFYHYKQSNNTWNLAGGQDIDTANLIATKYNLGFKLSIVDTQNMLTPYWRSGRFSGVLPVANGGTGQTTLTAAGINTGSGTLNFIPKYTATGTTLGNSIIFNNGSNVGIGTASPSGQLDVRTSANTSTIYLGTTATSQVADSGPQITFNGYLAGDPSANYTHAMIRGATASSTTNLNGGVLLFYTSDNLLAITERMRILSTGNVGIGTTSPTSLLDLSLASGATSGYRFKGYSDASTPYLMSLGTQTYQDNFQVQMVNGYAKIGTTINTANANLGFITNNTERMTILQSNGNVGIGTTSPSYKLDINASTLGLNVGNSRNSVLALATFGKTVVSTYTTASNYLQIGAGENAVGSTRLIGFGYSVTGNINQPAYIGYIETAGANLTKGDLIFGTRDVETDVAPTERMRITSSGNVGIGTTSPNSLLQVNGKTVVGSTSDNALEVFSNGDTEIGFSYATRGNIYSKIIGDIVTATPLEGEIAFQTALSGTLTERMRINKSGNVGIGTVSPTEKLHVVGNGLFSGNLNLIPTSGYSIMTQQSPNVSHGITGWLPNNAYSSATIEDTNNGGFSFMGATDAATPGALNFYGIMGTTSPTSNAINFRAAKKNGTTIQALASAENAMIFGNYGGTDLLQFKGNGDAAFGRFIGGGTTGLSIDNTGTLVRTSSFELKKDIVPINYGLNEILQLNPINFNWVNSDKYGDNNENGFIAEDVLSIIPNSVSADSESVFMDYSKLIPILTKAIQEQQALIKALEQRLLILENK